MNTNCWPSIGFVLTILFTTQNVHAQSGWWSYTGGGGIVPQATSMGLAANGDLLLNNSRLRPDGSVAWQRIYDLEGGLVPTPLNMLGELPDGRLVGVGRFLHSGGYRVVVVVTDAAGTPLVTRRLGEATSTTAGVYERMVRTPDGGFMLVGNTEVTYRFDADVELVWAKSYPLAQRPMVVQWLPDGGYYALTYTAGIAHCNAQGDILRILGTTTDRYDGNLGVTTYQSLVLHNNLLYAGVGFVFLQDGTLRANAGVLVLDTLGQVQGQLMNHELLSPADDPSASGAAWVAMRNGRLVASLSMTGTVGGWRNYLLDCAADLSDAHWYRGGTGNTTYYTQVLSGPQGVVVTGEVADEVMQLRFEAGTDLSPCLPTVPYIAAPLELVPNSGIPAAYTVATPNVDLQVVTSTPLNILTASPVCAAIGLTEQQMEAPTLYPNPARGTVTVELAEWPAANAQCVLLDACGRVVLQQAITGTRTLLSTQGLAPGLYQVRVDDDVQRGTATLVLVHE